MKPKQNIRSFTKDQLIEALSQMEEKPFRAKQIYQWLWEKAAGSFQEMTNLSQPLRDKLDEKYVLNKIEVSKKQVSSDGTIKTGFQLYDGKIVEGVLIPTEERITACISSQVGCSLNCKFCATGYLDRERNLTPDEIYDQVAIIKQQAEEHLERNLTNIVLMGMGEPLLNYSNVWEGIEKITSPEGLNISPRRITLSTVGIAKMIKRLADDGAKFKLALSLHAADDIKRSKIMPINDQNSLESLIEALTYYMDWTKNYVTLEYILFDRFNDSIEDAKKLVAFARKIKAKVNIIEYNPIGKGDFKRASEQRLNHFNQYLIKEGIFVSVRKSRGKDIDAACGQLANKS